MEEILRGTQLLLTFGIISDIVVFTAMMADLASGLYKAKMRGEFARSELLKRTGYKFCLYEGSMLIALCVDLLVHFTHVYEAIGLPRVMVHLPMVSFIMAIFWCAVEYMSIREKAADKVRSNIRTVEKLASAMFTREELVQILSACIKDAKKVSEGKSEDGKEKGEGNGVDGTD